MQTDQKPKGTVYPLTLPGTWTCLATDVYAETHPPRSFLFLTFDEEAFERATKDEESANLAKILKISSEASMILMQNFNPEIKDYILRLQALPCLVPVPTSAVFFGGRALQDPFWTSTIAISYLKAITKSYMIAHGNVKCMDRLIQFSKTHILAYNDAIVGVLKSFYETFRESPQVEEVLEPSDAETKLEKKRPSTKEEIKSEGSKIFENFETVTCGFMKDLTKHLDEVCLIATHHGNSERSIDFLVSHMHDLEGKAFSEILRERTGTLVPEFDEIPEKVKERLKAERGVYLLNFKRSCFNIPNFRVAFDKTYDATVDLLWTACSHAKIQMPRKRQNVARTFCKVVSEENQKEYEDVLYFMILLKTLLIG